MKVLQSLNNVHLWFEIDILCGSGEHVKTSFGFSRFQVASYARTKKLRYSRLLRISATWRCKQEGYCYYWLENDCCSGCTYANLGWMAVAFLNFESGPCRKVAEDQLWERSPSGSSRCVIVKGYWRKTGTMSRKDLVSRPELANGARAKRVKSPRILRIVWASLSDRMFTTEYNTILSVS